MPFDLFKVSLKVGHLLFQALPVPGQHDEKLFHLRHGVTRTVVRVNDVFGLTQAQAETLGPQRELEAGTVAGRVDSVASAGSFAFGLQQSHVFVKTHGPGGQVKLFGKVADCVSCGHGAGKAPLGMVLGGLTSRSN